MCTRLALPIDVVLHILSLCCRSEDAGVAARRDGARAAADAHAEAVQPLRGEVARMRQALGDLQGAYSQDMDRVSLPACQPCLPLLPFS